jgi:NADH dehydrogenase
VRVAQRDPRSAYTIQPLAQVGQFGFAAADLSNPQSVRAAVKSATAVINLVGTFGRGMHAAHVDGARHVAEAARNEGAGALVHISAIGADPGSASTYGLTKAEGEQAVRHAFPDATIIRPSVVFGPDDDLTNLFARLAALPIVPVIAPSTRFQPVYVRDLAKAIAVAALDPGSFGGKTYEVGGPQAMTMLDLNKTVLDLAGLKADLAPVPDAFGDLLSRLGWMPGAPLTRDQWLMLQRDNVVSGDAPGLDAFGINPTPLGAVGYEWLSRYGKGAKSARRRIHLTATN